MKDRYVKGCITLALTAMLAMSAMAGCGREQGGAKGTEDVSILENKAEVEAETTTVNTIDALSFADAGYVKFLREGMDSK